MTRYRFHSSPPDRSISPRPSVGSDAERLRKFGPVRPMPRESGAGGLGGVIWALVVFWPVLGAALIWRLA